MKRIPPVFRAVFVCVMLCCAGILIWLVPANRSVSRSIEKARDDIEWYNDHIEKQIKVDHVRYLDGILEKQEYLDENMTAEYDEYWRTAQIRTVARNTRQELRNEKQALESDIEFYQGVLDEMLHPEKYQDLGEEDEEYEEDDTNW